MPTPSIKITNIDGVLCKRCPKCGMTKPLTDFSADKSKNCGYSVQCKPCSKRKFARYYERNKERDRASTNAWRAANRGRYLEYCKSYRESPEGRFRFAIHQAKKRELEFTFSFDEYQSIIQVGICHYCQGALNETGSGLDRKDSSKGYITGNCVPCCWKCNLIRGEDNVSYAEMIEVAKLLKKLRQGAICQPTMN
jgi:uncharacterized C2H2 Zn-finger protein